MSPVVGLSGYLSSGITSFLVEGFKGNAHPLTEA